MRHAGQEEIRHTTDICSGKGDADKSRLQDGIDLPPQVLPC